MASFCLLLILFISVESIPQWPSSIVDLVRGWQACPFSDFKQSERSLRLGAYPSIVCGRIFTVFLIWPSVLGKKLPEQPSLEAALPKSDRS